MLFCKAQLYRVFIWVTAQLDTLTNKVMTWCLMFTSDLWTFYMYLHQDEMIEQPSSVQVFLINWHSMFQVFLWVFIWPCGWWSAVTTYKLNRIQSLSRRRPIRFHFLKKKSLFLFFYWHKNGKPSEGCKGVMGVSIIAIWRSDVRLRSEYDAVSIFIQDLGGVRESAPLLPGASALVLLWSCFR